MAAVSLDNASLYNAHPSQSVPFRNYVAAAAIGLTGIVTAAVAPMEVQMIVRGFGRSIAAACEQRDRQRRDMMELKAPILRMQPQPN